jgi:hypothetical protein
MGSNINPLTFFGSSSIIENSPQLSTNKKLDNTDVKQAFLKLLLDKVYLNSFQAATPLDSEENADTNEEDFTIFKQDIGNSFVNDMFRQQISDQLIQSDVFNLGDIGGVK